MTTLLDAPATTRKEKTMLKRKLAALADQETTTDLPAVEQESTSVVTDDATLEQSTELVTETRAEAAAETSERESVVEAVMEPSTPDAVDESKVAQPETRSFPMLGFKPSRKDMADDAVPYAPPMTASYYFASDDDDNDEDGSTAQRESINLDALTDDELADYYEAEIRQTSERIALQEAEDKARKEKEAKDAAEAKAKEKARIEKRGSRRMLGNIMLFGSAVAFIYGIAVPYVPWL